MLAARVDPAMGRNDDGFDEAGGEANGGPAKHGHPPGKGSRGGWFCRRWRRSQGPRAAPRGMAKGDAVGELVVVVGMAVELERGMRERR